MARLDIEKQKEIEPERMDYAIGQLHKAGIKSMVIIKENCIEFYFKSEKIKFFPYTGWATGKSIKDGRGLQKLLDQIKKP